MSTSPIQQAREQEAQERQAAETDYRQLVAEMAEHRTSADQSNRLRSAMNSLGLTYETIEQDVKHARQVIAATRTLRATEAEANQHPPVAESRRRIAELDQRIREAVAELHQAKRDAEDAIAARQSFEESLKYQRTMVANARNHSHRAAEAADVALRE